MEIRHRKRSRFLSVEEKKLFSTRPLHYCLRSPTALPSFPVRDSLRPAEVRSLPLLRLRGGTSEDALGRDGWGAEIGSLSLTPEDWRSRRSLIHPRQSPLIQVYW